MSDSTGETQVMVIPQSEFQRVQAAALESLPRLALLADMCRLNALSGVKRAGSGHLGSSFSAMDIVTWLYFQEMNTARLPLGHADRDIYFSSKGHDVPGTYAVLYALGIIPHERFVRLRRLGGMDGHPDVGVPGIEVNSGSLGMGLSKARGMAWAKKRLGQGGRVFVMTGDGELQEGQNYEALAAAPHQGISYTMIVDNNKVQSDKTVAEILNLRDLEAKLSAFGWHVRRCDGNDMAALQQVFDEFRDITDRPKALIADTIKGRGVSFMEHPQALKDGKGYYKYHAGAPDDAHYLQARDELIAKVDARLHAAGLEPVRTEELLSEEEKNLRNELGEPVSVGAGKAPGSMKEAAEYVVEAYGAHLVELGTTHPHLVVLDADLAADCRTRAFELTHPQQYIQCGIAEQDMVSMAGGLAHLGLLPVVNSFASFLSARGNEQIYNNATEKTKVIYVNHYAGLIPAGPGKSHQSIRDISLLAALPNMTIVQPGNPEETRQLLDWCVDEATENCAIRLAIGPSPRIITMPQGYRLTYGQGTTLHDGKDALLFAYGPVMLNEALIAAELLAERNFGLKIVNLPWLNRVDADWLAETVAPYSHIYVLEDHAPEGALGAHLFTLLHARHLLGAKSLHILAIEGWPACGTPKEALTHHRMDGASLADRIGR